MVDRGENYKEKEENQRDGKEEIKGKNSKSGKSICTCKSRTAEETDKIKHKT
jgi:hypothetical protein